MNLADLNLDTDTDYAAAVAAEAEAGRALIAAYESGDQARTEVYRLLYCEQDGACDCSCRQCEYHLVFEQMYAMKAHNRTQNLRGLGHLIARSIEMHGHEMTCAVLAHALVVGDFHGYEMTAHEVTNAIRAKLAHDLPTHIQMTGLSTLSDNLDLDLDLDLFMRVSFTDIEVDAMLSRLDDLDYVAAQAAQALPAEKAAQAEFDYDVRILARHDGHAVADTEVVRVQFSEYGEVTVTCGAWSRLYENEEFRSDGFVRLQEQIDKAKAVQGA